MTSPFFTFWPLLDDRLLVDAGAGVRAHEFAQLVDVDAVLRVVLELLLAVGHLAVLGDDDLLGGDAGDLAGVFGDDDRLGVARDLAFHAGADERRLGLTSSGTPWRCMFEPINARFASSCSRNGIRPAATETSCFGETSM